MKFPTLALLAAAALTAGSCTKRPVRPQFTVVSTDSLISGNGFSCDFEYRFASIANAQVLWCKDNAFFRNSKIFRQNL